MRKGLVILLAVIATVLPAGTALAAEDTPAAGTQDAGTVLAIDNENLYPGMDQPYSRDICLLAGGAPLSSFRSYRHRNCRAAAST